MPPADKAEVTLTEDEAAYALASIVAAADGAITHAETRRVESEWLRYATTRGLSPQQARGVAARCRDLRADLGKATLLKACERTLVAAPHRHEAVLFAVHVAYADGRLVGPERAQLERVLTLVGLSVDQLPRRTGALRSEGA